MPPEGSLPEAAGADGVALGIAEADLAALTAGTCRDPHRVLGAHAAVGASGAEGVVVRAWHPDAVAAECVVRGAPRAMRRVAPGLFAAWLPGLTPHSRYRVLLRFADGQAWRHEDPYRFSVAFSDADGARLHDGTHRALWRVLGARRERRDGRWGTRFAVFAPHARAVRVVGDFCAWDGRLLPMAAVGHGVFALFVPGIEEGAAYKYEILTADGLLRFKSDPMGQAMAKPPEAASIVTTGRHRFDDRAWMRARRRHDPRRRPLSIYEVHLGSWARDGDRRLTLRELAPRLLDHVTALGFSHLELMPVMEHAYYASWGYQVTGFYAATQRYGPADDLRWFVDACHQRGVGVILDWVPAHFPKDDYALRHFDGPRLYERDGEHRDWGTLRFDYDRGAVRSFLLSSALYWLHEFHADGLRVDAVSWVVYRDYLEGEAPWTEDAGGRALLRELNRAVAEELPGAMVIAEESTECPGVTAPLPGGGLGFTFKWDMGWMNDSLAYFATPLSDRSDRHELLTFPLSYQRDEAFVSALSHDEVVHLKRSLLSRMPGEEWERFANLRVLLAHAFLRPGKPLLFMGTELAPEGEWNHDVGLDWSRAQEPGPAGVAAWIVALGEIYRAHPALWRRDAEDGGFAWIDGSDRDQGVVAFVRRDGARHVVVVLHHGVRPCSRYRIGVPSRGAYRVLACSDAARFGGNGAPLPGVVRPDRVEMLGWRQSLALDLPPLSAIVLTPRSARAAAQTPPEGAEPRASVRAPRPSSDGRSPAP